MTLNDQTFLKRFAMRDLGPEFFDHRGHLRMAWIHFKTLSAGTGHTTGMRRD